MKRWIAFSLFALLIAGCWPLTPAEQESRNRTVERSFRCMWTGDCR